MIKLRSFLRYFLFIVSYVAFAAGAIVVTYSYGGEKENARMAIVGMGVVAIGFFLRRQAERTGLPTAEEIMVADDRPPILFLRRFAEDGRADEPDQFMPTFETAEEAFLKPFKRLGPVIGLAGSAAAGGRVVGYSALVATDEKWQDVVLNILKLSQCNVVMLAGSSGLAWELSQVVNHGYLSKSIVFIP